jgi:hypothetical protein
MLVCSAAGQCQPGWSERFPPPYLSSDFPTITSAVFDDGSGPRLVVSGLRQRGDDAMGLQAWDGQTWSTLALPAGAASADGVVWAADGHVPARLVFAGFDLNSSTLLQEVYILEGGQWRATGFPGHDAPWLPEGIAPGLDPAGEELFLYGVFQRDFQDRSYVYRWDGQAWGPIDHEGSGAGSVRSLVWFDDGSGAKLYAGVLDGIDGVPASGVARWDGSGWEEVGGGCPAQRPTLAVHDDGNGPALWALDTNGQVLANWDGAAWTSFPIDLGEGRFPWRLTPVEVGGQERLYWVEGTELSARLWRWDGSGSELLSEVTEGYIWSLTSDRSHALGGGVFAAGTFLHAGGDPAASVARWDGAAWHDLANGDVGNGVPESDAVLAIDERAGVLLGKRVFVIGELAGGRVTGGIASWDGDQWRPIGPGETSPVWPHTLASGDLGEGVRLFTAGRVPIDDSSDNEILAWDGQEWSVAGGGIGGDLVTELAFGRIAGGEPTLFVGGMFEQIGGEPNAGVAGLTAQGWVSLGGGLPSTTGRSSVGALAVHNDGTGPALYAEAPYKPVNPDFKDAVVRWDGQSWERVGDSFSHDGGNVTIGDLLSANLGDGWKLYAGGHFDGPTGMFHNVAVWNGSDWLPLGEGLPLSVRSLAVLNTSGGPRLAAVDDLQVDGEPAQRVWLWDGSVWSPFGGEPDGHVTGIAQARHDYGAIYLSGSFHSIDGVATDGVARYGCESCRPDFSADGVLDTRDVIAFLSAWAAGDDSADFDGNGVLDTDDFFAYLNAWAAGC